MKQNGIKIFIPSGTLFFFSFFFFMLRKFRGNLLKSVYKEGTKSWTDSTGALDSAYMYGLNYVRLLHGALILASYSDLDPQWKRASLFRFTARCAYFLLFTHEQKLKRGCCWWLGYHSMRFKVNYRPNKTRSPVNYCSLTRFTATRVF